jgi:hypothetical protein
MNNSLAANIYETFCLLKNMMWSFCGLFAICTKHILCKYVCILPTVSLQVLKSFYIALCISNYLGGWYVSM